MRRISLNEYSKGLTIQYVNTESKPHLSIYNADKSIIKTLYMGPSVKGKSIIELNNMWGGLKVKIVSRNVGILYYYK